MYKVQFIDRTNLIGVVFGYFCLYLIIYRDVYTREGLSLFWKECRHLGSYSQETGMWWGGELG